MPSNRNHVWAECRCRRANSGQSSPWAYCRRPSIDWKDIKVVDVRSATPEGLLPNFWNWRAVCDIRVYNQAIVTQGYGNQRNDSLAHKTSRSHDTAFEETRLRQLWLGPRFLYGC